MPGRDACGSGVQRTSRAWRSGLAAGPQWGNACSEVCLGDEHEYPPTWPEDHAPGEPPPGHRLVGRLARAVLKGMGGAVLVAIGAGLPRKGEDRLWRLRHPDDDDINPFHDQ